VNGLVSGWSVNARSNPERRRFRHAGQRLLQRGSEHPERGLVEARSGAVDFADTSGFYFNDVTVQTNGVGPAQQRNDSRINLSNNIRTFRCESRGCAT